MATNICGRIVTIEQIGRARFWKMEVYYAHKGGSGDVIVLCYRELPIVKTWHPSSVMEDVLLMDSFEYIQYNQDDDITFVVNRGGIRYRYTLLAA